MCLALFARIGHMSTTHAVQRCGDAARHAERRATRDSLDITHTILHLFISTQNVQELAAHLCMKKGSM